MRAPDAPYVGTFDPVARGPLVPRGEDFRLCGGMSVADASLRGLSFGGVIDAVSANRFGSQVGGL
jgi:hypothetical protein